ncbi:TRAP transporter small permease [Zhengella sp. ZM62]|uniref:TRAP transporter small permease n=1 Tax=Zhengella sedimenti TaxID=3390035 RepID=UPI0039758446
MTKPPVGPLERMSLAVENVAGVLLALITILIVVSAIGRYLLAWPVPDAFDLSRFLIGAAIMWGFASVGYRGSHIKVDIVAEMLPPGARRWIDSFAWAVLLLFSVLLTWKMFGRVASAYHSGEATFDLRMPAWIFLGIIWLGVAFANVAILARLVMVATGRATLEHFENTEIADPEETERRP